MKKYLSLIALGFFFTAPVKAQMADVLGTLAIGGTVGVGDMQMVAKGQGALNNLRFQDDLMRFVTDVQLYGADQSTSFDGFKGLDWNISNEGYEKKLEFNHLNAALCVVCRNNSSSVNRVEINSGGTCQASDNHVEIYF